MIGAGHRPDDILNYTLGQFKGYGTAVVKLENQRLAALLDVITIGSRGDGKAIDKKMQALTTRD